MDVLRTQLIYEFGGFQLDLGQRVLISPDGKPHFLSARLFETLLYLVEHRGELIDKESLLKAAWPNVVVEENSLSQCISALRRMLGERPGEHRFIVTEPGRGFRFVAEVAALPPPAQVPPTHGISAAMAAPSLQPEGAVNHHRWTRARLAIAAIAASLLAAGAIAFLKRADQPVTSPSEYAQLTDFADSATAPALSPDGRMVAFIRGGTAFLGRGQIYVKLLPAGEPIRLTNETRQIFAPTFTPDGTRVAYSVVEAASNGVAWETWTVPVSGGEATRLLPNASGLTWIGDRTVLFSELKTGLHMGIVTATEDRAGRREIYFPAHERAMAHFSYASPDRRQILLVEMDRRAQWQRCRLVPFDGHDAGRQVGPVGRCTSAAWSPDGKWMYFGVEIEGQSHLWRQRAPNGTPEQVTFGPSQEESIAVMPDGRAFITSVGIQQNTVWMHAAGGEQQITSEGFATSPQLSADGARVYYLLRQNSMPSTYGFWSGAPSELWCVELSSGKRERLLPGFSVIDYDISRDGKDVVFSIAPNAGPSQIWLAPLDRRTPPRALVQNGDQPAFGAEGEILFRFLDEKVNYLFRVRRDGSHAERVLAAPILNFLSVAPDGAFVTVFSGEGDDAETVLIDVRTGTRKRIGSGLRTSRWSIDGRYFYIAVSETGLHSSGSTLAIPLATAGAVAEITPGLGAATNDPRRPPLPQGAQMLEHSGIHLASDPSSYVFVRSELKRNLFKVPLH
jgi:Tol biopolymer transport system component/DNA-binding winged helix-turn-helix (wHTH) protein